VLLAKAANAVGLRLAGVGLVVSRLPFNPIELLEESESLLGRTATFLSGFEGIDEAPSRMGHASQMGRPIQCAPGGVAIAHHYAAVITQKGLWVNLAAAWLIIEQHDRFGTVLAAPIGPHIRCAGGLFVLFLQHLNRCLVAMNERL